MEKTIYILAELAIPGIIVVACLAFLVSGMSVTTTENGTSETKTGIYEVLGTVPTKEEADDNVHTTPDEVEGTAAASGSKVTYNNIIVKTWVPIGYKELFSVTTNGITYVGTDENGGFNIKIEDVTDKKGTSVLTRAETDITEEMEDALVIVLYNTTDETLMFCESGAFKIRIKVTDSNGKITKTTVTIPVEITFDEATATRS